MYNLADLREDLVPADILDILSKYEIYPVSETPQYFVFPTVCHNLDGGSHKLFYYKNNHFFRCYTECDSAFDIFELIIKINRLRGYEMSLPEAIRSAGFENQIETDEDISSLKKAMDDVEELMNKTPVVAKKLSPVEELSVLKYSNDMNLLQPWLEEGISRTSLEKFDIKYSPLDEAIVIPHRDMAGDLVGIRGRFFGENAYAKYMPLTFKGKFLAHSLMENLYGIYENRNSIKKQKSVILFESEKSVLKFGSYFGEDKNIGLAVCGNKISNQQIYLLKEMGVTDVCIAFDNDFKTAQEQDIIIEKYFNIAKRLRLYFSTSVIIDYGNRLGYKDSPIDCGKETFLELFINRRYV